MNEPETVRKARELVERGRTVVEEQRQRIIRLQSIGAPTDAAEEILNHFVSTLSALERHFRAVQDEDGAWRIHI
jgi:hypothetical protein